MQTRSALPRWALVCILTGCLFWIAACDSVPGVTQTPVPTAVLIPAEPTATHTRVPPTATLPDLPGPADVARTATAKAIRESDEPELTALITAAQADLQTRVDVLPDNLQPARTEAVTWANPDLECGTLRGADAGNSVEGYRLDFIVGEAVYTYHTDQGTTARLCLESKLYDDNPDLFRQLDPIADSMMQLAQERLARDLDLSPRAVQVVSARPVEWPDTSLGCPQDDIVYEQITVAGYRIVLEVGEDDRTVFHTDFDRLVRCDTDEGP